jgi:hypothetical protein
MKLPRYVHGYVDRHGKVRFYLRRRGFKKIALPGLPWSAEFMAAYQAALAGQPLSIGVSRVLPGSMHALTVSYYSSPEYLAMKSNSQQVRRNIIDTAAHRRCDRGITNFNPFRHQHAGDERS